MTFGGSGFVKDIFDGKAECLFWRADPNLDT
jgi:hypothetical protein